MNKEEKVEDNHATIIHFDISLDFYVACAQLKSRKKSLATELLDFFSFEVQLSIFFLLIITFGMSNTFQRLTTIVTLQNTVCDFPTANYYACVSFYLLFHVSVSHCDFSEANQNQMH